VQPTVTAAHVVRGHVAAGAWSGGVTISAERAAAAVATLAGPLGVSVERAAEALVATADATMARALRRVSVERGIDPRRVPLVAFGGGGPLHACGLAERLGMTQVIVPPHAGVLSALGLAMAPERRETLASCLVRPEALDADAVARLLVEAAAPLGAASGAAPRWWMRVRYEGQGHEIDLPVAPGDDGAAIAARFAARHQARTGFVLPRPVEAISVRVALEGAPWPVQWHRPERAGPLADDVDDGRAMTRTVRGAAVVRLPDATLRIPPGWTGRTLPQGGWLLEAQP
jgi:N-methylhydantoinase A